MNDLRRMRLFACLAVIFTLEKCEAARRLMLSAIVIGRQVLAKDARSGKLVPERPRYWRVVFRTILFFESWFAYNISRESRIVEDDLAYFPLALDDEFPETTFHYQVGQLGELAAQISLDQTRTMHLRAEQALTHCHALNEWHSNLPEHMQMKYLQLRDAEGIAKHTRRSLLQLHTLFLGLFTEPHRLLLVDVGTSRLEDGKSGPASHDDVAEFEKQSMLAARQGARVVSLLHFDNMIRAHCWVSIYTSFTGCCVLLFSAAQQLLTLSSEASAQDLTYAASFLDILSFCSLSCRTAKVLHHTLQPIYNSLREIAFSDVCRQMRKLNLTICEIKQNLPSFEEIVQGSGDTCREIWELAQCTIDLLKKGANIEKSHQDILCDQ
jgi:hypothetical protein